jgi:outer membrane lipoprotein-sorting protein
MNLRTLTNAAAAAVIVCAVAPRGAGAQSGTTYPPAWEAFTKTAATITDYTETLTAHEIKGDRTEDRVYHFAFAKPAHARSEIVSGPDKGSVAVWNGGDTVRGHKGGFASFIKLTISVHDPRTTDLRGKTIDAAFYPTMIADYESGGKLTEEPGTAVDGTPTDDVVLTPSDPAKLRNLTKDVLVFSRATHLPIEHMGYEGTQLVEDEHFTDIKVNPSLPESTFQM